MNNTDNNKNDIYQYLKQYDRQLDTQTLITICEEYYQQSIYNLHHIKFNENYNTALEQNDISNVKILNDALIIDLNNVGIIGLQSGAPTYILEHIQTDQLAKNVSLFLNIFTNILTRAIYESKQNFLIHYMHPHIISIIKSKIFTHIIKQGSDDVYINYHYDTTNFKQVLSNTMHSHNAQNRSIYINKCRSVFSIKAALLKYYNHKIDVQISKLLPHKYDPNQIRMRIGNGYIGKNIIGQHVILFNKIKITIVAYARGVYEQITADNYREIHQFIQCLLPYHKYIIQIIPHSSIYQPCVLGQASVHRGCCIS